MRILFLGDIVGKSGCSKIIDNLSDQIKEIAFNLLAFNLTFSKDLPLFKLKKMSFVVKDCFH